MVRNRPRKTKIGLTDEAIMRVAVKAVMQKKKSAREAAIDYGISRTSLSRYIKKCQENGVGLVWPEDDDDIGLLELNLPIFKPNYAVRRIFSDDEELALSDYFKQASKLHHGLPRDEGRKLAYDFAVKNSIKIPESWAKNALAGDDWMASFMKRNASLSLRKPEATSLARSMGFNKPVVMKFYGNLETIYERQSFSPERVFNLDETGVTTVQTPGKVIATKGEKQVGQLTSAERGQLVTLCCIINAIGNSVPPVFIFPRVNMKDSMMIGAPAGSVGAANLSGWMTTGIFVDVIKHFMKHIKCSITSPVLLLYDNHVTHINVETLQIAKDNGIILLTIPPHTSHKLQPLDKTVYGPFKRYYNDACRAWLLNHPGERITIHNIATLVGTAYPKAFTPSNITNGFASTGIWPFDKNKYSDCDFTAASVTDQPLTISANPNPGCSHDDPLEVHTSPNEGRLKAIKLTITPEMILPFPKVNQNPSRQKGARKRIVSEILTDTPVKKRIEQEHELRAAGQPRPKKNIKRALIDKPKVGRPKKVKIVADTESSCDSEGVDDDFMSMSSGPDYDFIEEETSNVNLGLSEEIADGDFILVEFAGKKNTYLYVAEVLSHSPDDKPEQYSVKFMKRKLPGFYFVFPTKEEQFDVLKEDIIAKLPKPVTHGGTERTLRTVTFTIDLSKFGSEIR